MFDKAKVKIEPSVRKSIRRLGVWSRLGLGLKLSPSNGLRILNKELTRFLQSPFFLVELVKALLAGYRAFTCSLMQIWPEMPQLTSFRVTNIKVLWGGAYGLSLVTRNEELLVSVTRINHMDECEIEFSCEIYGIVHCERKKTCSYQYCCFEITRRRWPPQKRKPELDLLEGQTTLG